MDLISIALSSFEQHLGYVPTHLFAAPGRVNLMGEQTDDNDGLALPVAINHVTVVAAARRSDRTVRLLPAGSTDAPLTFEVATDIPKAKTHWARHGQGVLSQLCREGYLPGGMDLVIAGNVPQAAGFGAATSLAMAIGLATVTLYDLELSPALLARIVQLAEREYVGRHCSIMGPLIAACGEPGRAQLIDCRSLQLEPVALPESLAIVVIGNPLSSASDRDDLRRQYRQAAQRLSVQSLRDLSPKQLQQAGKWLEPNLYRLARHVLSENERTVAAADALRQGDLPSLSRLMAQSHHSLIENVAVTFEPGEKLVASLAEALDQDGGVRMLSSGAVLVLLPDFRVEELSARVMQLYPGFTGLAATIHCCQAGLGAHQLYFE